MELGNGEKENGTDQARGIFLPFHPGRTGRDFECASGDGICPAPDQLCGLG